MTYRIIGPLAALLGLLGIVSITGCDSGFDGERFENQPPRTYLAVRDTSLVENLCAQTPQGFVCTGDDDLFTSTVFVAWSGVDPDGFVVGYDLRYYDYAETLGPEEGWNFTTRRDTIILLPIPAGQETAKVVFEVRAIDNEGAKDPNPARTVFPIINSPPSLNLVQFELPPDTTWGVISFAWEASDPDGPDDLAAIEVSLNDPDNFVSLPPTVSFITLVADDTSEGTTVTDARVYFGRSFVATDITLPGLRLDDDNTIYVRSVDRTGATSSTVMYPDPDQLQNWYVRRPTSNILLVNDVRSTRADETMPFHEATLSGYLPAGVPFDVWDLSRPVSGTQRSNSLPPVGSPTLRETFRQWDYIYWVAGNITGNVQGSNLAYSATFLEEFAASDGRLFVQVPFTQPPGGEVDLNNPAFDILPMESLVFQQGNVPPNLAIPNGGAVSPVEPVPGTGRQLPQLTAERLALTLPYTMNFATTVPLYQGAFIDRDNNNVPWEGGSFVASMDTERRVALMGLNLYSLDRYNFAGPGGDGEAPCLAVQYILEGLTFPGTPGTCPTP